ncbi:MAG: phage major capsid protein [Planctomycetota bacterium]|jgi:HK97 family phage major capsid protein
MKTITEMRAEIGDLMENLGKMKAQVIAENREPNEEERQNAADLLDRVDELEKVIALEERIQKKEEKLSKPAEKPTKPEPKDTSRSKQQQEKKDRFLTFGEQLQAVMRARIDGVVDPRLYKRAAAGMSETVASDGGFLVQTDFATELIQNVFETGKLASRVNKISMSGNANSIKFNGIDESSRATGSRYGGIQMYWLEEAGTKTKSKPKFKQIELSLKKLIGLCYATDELLEDASALEGIVRSAFQSEMGFMLDEAIINGTGAGTPLGIMNSNSMVQVTKETGQDASTVWYENLLTMWSRLLPDSQPNAIWLIHQDVFPQLGQLHLKVGTGGSGVYIPPGGASATPYASLFGRPILVMEQCATLGTAGDIILGDFGRGYYFVDKGGMKQDVSIHVNYTTDESVFRFVYRCDGQPVLTKALTPFKGTNTLSHFIRLQTRS